MANTSTNFGWAIIAEYDESWYQEFIVLVNAIDAEVYAIETASGKVDHGNLLGLTDDDHTQYLNTSRHAAVDHSSMMAAVTIGEISDVTITSPAAGNTLRYNSSESIWVDGDHGDIAGLLDDDHTQYAKVSGRVGEDIWVHGTIQTDQSIRLGASAAAGSADMFVIFGKVTGNEYLQWDHTNGKFYLTDDLHVSGALMTDSQFYVNFDQPASAGDGQINFGSDAGQHMMWNYTNNRFELTTTLYVSGSVIAASGFVGQMVADPLNFTYGYAGDAGADATRILNLAKYISASAESHEGVYVHLRANSGADNTSLIGLQPYVRSQCPVSADAGNLYAIDAYAWLQNYCGASKLIGESIWLIVSAGGNVANEAIGLDINFDVGSAGSAGSAIGLRVDLAEGGSAGVYGKAPIGIWVSNNVSNAYAIYAQAGNAYIAGKLETASDLYVNSDYVSGDEDATIYFNATGHLLKFDYGNDRFAFSDEVYSVKFTASTYVTAANLEATSGVYSYGGVYVNSDYVSGDEDATIYFNATGHSLKFDYGEDRFKFDTELYATQLSSIGVTASTGTFGGFNITDDHMNLKATKTPSSSTATGASGDMCWDSGYVYVCVATNTWKRATLSPF